MAVGCLAERYGKDLAESLPEADAVLGFDDYPDIAARLRSIVGETHHAHTPQDRRWLPDLAGRARRLHGVGARPRELDELVRRRGPTPTDVGVGGPATGPRRAPSPRRRPDGRPQARQRLRPALLVLRDPELPRLFVSRRPSDVRRRRAGSPSRAPASCSWSARTPRPTARTSATSGCSRPCCPSWPRWTASTGGCPACSPPRRVPAVEAIAGRPAWRAVLRPVLPARQRHGPPDAPASESFLGLLEGSAHAPEAGVRSNVIVGFPGETEEDLQTVRLPRRGPDT